MTKSTETPSSPDVRYWIDLLIRIILGLVFAFAAGMYLKNGLVALSGLNTSHIDAHQIGHILSVLSVGLYTLMIGCVYIMRIRPVSKFAGIVPSVAAVVGGFMMAAILFCPQRNDLPLWIQLLSSGLVITGNLLAFFILTRLGRSFSILPEGRRLITTGPYSVVRHPLYLAEAVATVGVVLNFLSVPAVLLMATHFALQMVRIHFEEKVLKKTFPEYADYAKASWRLIPGLY